MSKTYRRIGAAKACSARYLDPWEKKYEYYEGRLVYMYTRRTPKEIAKLKAEFHSDSYCEMTTPMWWYHECHQVPLRRKERDLFREMLKSKHLDELEAVIFPHWKKPHIYYW